MYKAEQRIEDFKRALHNDYQDEEEYQVVLYNKEYLETCRTEMQHLKSLEILLNNQISMLGRRQSKMVTDISKEAKAKSNLQNELKLLYGYAKR